PALAAAPVINDVLAALGAQNGCKLARMSGSGATCFALFEDADAGENAAKALRLAHPDWWVAQTDEAPT
nr:4-(cytidine 5'-diphospho)-2-C-methyl-D-erythritol kinase [Octadecabacter sp.]